MINSKRYFGDLQRKLSEAVDVVYKSMVGFSQDQINIAISNAQRSVVNAHGKFYGLRSKYDGSGNKRVPVKA